MMIRTSKFRRITARAWCACALLMFASTAHAQRADTGDLARLLSHEAPIEGGSIANLSRIALGEDVLRIARADLSDVRIVTAAGEPVPFIVDSGARPMPSDVPFRVPATTVDAGESRDGTRREPGLYRERFRVTTPGEPPAAARWSLEFIVPRERWIRQVRVIANAGSDSERVLYEGNLFRLPAPLRARESVAIETLPDGTILTVELSGDDFFVTPAFTWVARRAFESAPRLTVPLAIESTTRYGARTVVRLPRPPGVMPDRLRIITSTPDYHRTVEIRDAQAGEESRPIGRGDVYRVDMLADAQTDELHVDPAHGDTIEVVFHDGDSPTLADLRIEADVVAPSLVARIPDGAMLRFGGGRVSAPRYDLAGLMARDAGDRLLRSVLPEVRLGEVRSSPSFDTSPALSFAMRAGRAVEREGFSMRAPLMVEAATEGLTRIVPTAALLSAGQPGLTDMRIVDGRGLQWPYFLGDSTVAVETLLTIGEGTRDGEWTHFTLRPGVARVESQSVSLDINADFFDRDVRLIGIDAETGEEHVLATRSIFRAHTDERDAIVIAGPARRVSAWRLEVRDADDAPLSIVGARAVTRTPEIFLVAPNDAYEVLVGDEQASRPAYEMSRARSLVLQIPAADAALGELSGNPAHRTPSWYERAGSATLALWAALLLAVVVLGGLTMRLARMPLAAPAANPTSSDSDSDPDPDSDSDSDSDPDPDPDSER